LTQRLTVVLWYGKDCLIASSAAFPLADIATFRGQLAIDGGLSDFQVGVGQPPGILERWNSHEHHHDSTIMSMAPRSSRRSYI
jgi:hypothetical protein